MACSVSRCAVSHRSRGSTMRFGVSIPADGRFADPAAIRAVVEAAEDLGYESAWFSDHIAVPAYATEGTSPCWYDALACCLVGAGWTRRLRFGTDVLVLPYRHPLVVAKLVATADQLSGGRLTIGAGVGYIRGEFEALGTPAYERRGAVTTEYLDVLRTAWESSGSLSFQGNYLQFTDVHLEPNPRQRPFPLWAGGNGAAARRRAALHANGWHPLFPSPSRYTDGREEILRLRAAAGLSDSFTFSLSTALARIRLSDRDGGRAASVNRDLPDEYDYRPDVPITETGRPYFVGTPDELASDVRTYASAGVDHVVLRFWTPAQPIPVTEFISQMERWMRHVAPATTGT
ncbi:TIGR03619 family F420-dependent LLM class oxidoreductase [Sphaerimonospora cavernae]|uniref:TIGR03619 family F420-dependent LLM class oxidoreductase n=1 Tax=Sphaerimonospora cavernae TaxID=1740611 RepID=A0ABV6U3X2_9ACTN